MNSLTHLKQHLNALYGEQAGESVFAQLFNRLQPHMSDAPAGRARLSERDAVLITYGDQLTRPHEKPLATLGAFCRRHAAGLFSTIHILPFYPFTSDDGFSVVDFRAVDPRLGTWDDIARLGEDFKLMFDAVVNHVSASSVYAMDFRTGAGAYPNFLLQPAQDFDATQVIRPRTSPLLTPFETPAGLQPVWTTFSADQIDLNYNNPRVLLEVLDVLLYYVAHGAAMIRLDAIAFLWKKTGTTCLHLPETHRIIQIMRCVLDIAAPHVLLVTETNVPHVDNISYFGDGSNEAQMVYNFALPPLVLHTLQAGDATRLTRWAETIRAPSTDATFFNFLASHDGIGLNPARGILTENEIDTLVRRTQSRGGLLGLKALPGGGSAPYELNINYMDALASPDATDAERLALMLCAHAIQLAVIGVPGIYMHSWLGSRGWHAGVSSTGHNRAINREKLAVSDVENDIGNPDHLRHGAMIGLAQLMHARQQAPAFDPFGGQLVLDAGPEVFALIRQSGQAAPVMCVHNVTAMTVTVDVPTAHFLGSDTELVNLIGENVPAGGRVSLLPYECMWITH
jgi:sucrose phosphorylase